MNQTLSSNTTLTDAETVTSRTGINVVAAAEVLKAAASAKNGTILPPLTASIRRACPRLRSLKLAYS